MSTVTFVICILSIIVSIIGIFAAIKVKYVLIIIFIVLKSIFTIYNFVIIPICLVIALLWLPVFNVVEIGLAIAFTLMKRRVVPEDNAYLI